MPLGTRVRVIGIRGISEVQKWAIVGQGCDASYFLRSCSSSSSQDTLNVDSKHLRFVDPLPSSDPAEIDAPPELICPISRCLISHPVTAPDGMTYDESAIREWLSYRQSSPITTEHMTEEQLETNVEIQLRIAEWKASNPSTSSTTCQSL